MFSGMKIVKSQYLLYVYFQIAINLVQSLLPIALWVERSLLYECFMIL